MDVAQVLEQSVASPAAGGPSPDAAGASSGAGGDSPG